ncbi:MAG: tetratricopeptide repeat protein, partial [Gemmataceae bacterium]
GEQMASLLGLDKADLAEWSSANFTPLDVHYLEERFMLHDAARGLESPFLQSAKSKAKPASWERAASAFAWVVRQVRLLPTNPAPIYEPPAPPLAVLRRGEGTGLERALVFLALLEQLGLEEGDDVTYQGVLLFSAKDKNPIEPWACGVIASTEPDQIYLFDHRMGLPLPGPAGKGVATLEQARKDPAILDQLRVDKLVYDHASSDLASVEMDVVCPVSAAAPRMKLLQDRFLRDRSWQGKPLPMQVRVAIAEDVQGTLAKVGKAAGKSDRVVVWKPGSVLLRRFLPPEEGGSDMGKPFEIRKLVGFTAEDDPSVAQAMTRERLYQLSYVPWEAYPPVFRDPVNFRPDIGLGQQLRGIFAAPFVKAMKETGGPRDQMLRGRFNRAIPEMVRELDMYVAMRRRLQEATDVRAELSEWIQRAISANADQIRSKGTPNEKVAAQRLASLFKWKPGEPIELVIGGAIAGPRSAQLTYDLEMCRHDQASRLQERVDLGDRAGLDLRDEKANARQAWLDAEGYWKEFLDSFSNRPGAPSARFWLGQALEKLGNLSSAQENYRNANGLSSDMEKLGRLWLASRLNKS